MFGVLSQTIHQILPGRSSIDFHLCTGTNPLLDSNQIKLNFPFFALYILSLILNIIIPIVIRVYQKKTNSNETNQTEPKILTDLTTSFCCVALLSLNVASIAGSHNIKHPALINQFPYYIIAYLLQLIFPNINTCFMVLIYFYRNKTLRTSVTRSAIDFMNSMAS